MKHHTILIKFTWCFYLCGGTLIKCFNNGIDKLQYPNMGITNLWRVEATQPLHKYINYLKVVTRHLHPFNKVENLQIHDIFNFALNKVVTTKNFHMGYTTFFMRTYLSSKFFQWIAVFPCLSRNLQIYIMRLDPLF